MNPGVRVILPTHLRGLARVDGDVFVAVQSPVTVDAVLTALEARFPVLRGTIRDPATGRRRAFVRYFVGQQDWSHEPTDRSLPPGVAEGLEPVVIVAAIAGG